MGARHNLGYYLLNEGVLSREFIDRFSSPPNRPYKVTDLDTQPLGDVLSGSIIRMRMQYTDNNEQKFSRLSEHVLDVEIVDKQEIPKDQDPCRGCVERLTGVAGESCLGCPEKKD